MSINDYQVLLSATNITEVRIRDGKKSIEEEKELDSDFVFYTENEKNSI
jgi:hypothetical protein